MPKGVLPAFMFLHRSGWILGDFLTYERFVRDLVADSGAAAVFVNYTPSPEVRYPVAINEAYAATKWGAESGAQIDVDGNSLGGNMAAVVARMVKAKATPALRAQALFWTRPPAAWPSASLTVLKPSRSTNSTAILLVARSTLRRRCARTA